MLYMSETRRAMGYALLPDITQSQRPLSVLQLSSPQRYRISNIPFDSPRRYKRHFIVTGALHGYYNRQKSVHPKKRKQ